VKIDGREALKMWTDGREVRKFWMGRGRRGNKCERNSDVVLSGAESSKKTLISRIQYSVRQVQDSLEQGHRQIFSTELQRN